MKGYQYIAISTDNYNHSIKIVQEHSTDKKLQNIPVEIQLKKLQIYYHSWEYVPCLI